MTESVIYRCSWERRLVEGGLGMDGDLCPFCETGHLTTIAKVTSRMLAEHESWETA